MASDISAGMLAYGRERAAAAGLENIEFVQADAAALTFPDASFDAAVSRWGIIFEPDGEGTAARVRTFLKPGARMAISSWGPPDRVPFLAIPMSTAMRRLGVPPPPPGTPGPLSRPTPEALGGLLEAAGFSDVNVEEDDLHRLSRQQLLGRLDRLRLKHVVALELEIDATEQPHRVVVVDDKNGRRFRFAPHWELGESSDKIAP